jgi:hypothetical protein
MFENRVLRKRLETIPKMKNFIICPLQMIRFNSRLTISLFEPKIHFGGTNALGIASGYHCFGKFFRKDLSIFIKQPCLTGSHL